MQTTKSWNERIKLRVEIFGSDPLRLRDLCEAFVNELDFDGLAERIVDEEALERTADELFDGNLDQAAAATIAEEAQKDFLATISHNTTGADALAVSAEFLG